MQRSLALQWLAYGTSCRNLSVVIVDKGVYMHELFEAFDKVIIATSGYWHYYGTTTTSAHNLCQ